jgi:hypothetical protein
MAITVQSPPEAHGRSRKAAETFKTCAFRLAPGPLHCEHPLQRVKASPLKVSKIPLRRKNAGSSWNARLLLRTALCVLTILFVWTCAAQTTVQTYHNRADQALQSFLLKFWNGSQH